MAAECSEGLPVSPTDKSISESIYSSEGKSISRSPSTSSIRGEEKWPVLLLSKKTGKNKAKSEYFLFIPL